MEEARSREEEERREEILKRRKTFSPEERRNLSRRTGDTRAGKRAGNPRRQRFGEWREQRCGALARAHAVGPRGLRFARFSWSLSGFAGPVREGLVRDLP